jgi:hypothetical protein
MKEGAVYPEYIGVSDVSTRSAEQMGVEAFFEGQPSIIFDEPEGFDIGDPPDLHLQPQYEQLNFDLTLETKESAGRLRELARETHRRCLQLGLFRLARIPMVVSWFREGHPRPLLEERLQIGSAGTPEEALIAVAKKPSKRS